MRYARGIAISRRHEELLALVRSGSYSSPGQTLASQVSREAGLANVCHLVGGIDAWAASGGPVDE